MNADKFMIGDWFSFRIDGKTYIEKVLGITPSGLLVRDPYGNSEDEVCDAWSDDASEEDDGYIPIPITKEILEKNGFIKKCVNTGYDSWVNYDPYPFYNLELIDDEDGLHLEDLYNLKVEYVHQLQQLLRLCGIKKEIVL